MARKSKGTAVLLSILLTPAAYLYVDKPGLALVNFLTCNYALLGIIIVPIHCASIIGNARRRVERAQRR